MCLPRGRVVGGQACKGPKSWSAARICVPCGLMTGWWERRVVIAGRAREMLDWMVECETQCGQQAWLAKVGIGSLDAEKFRLEAGASLS